MLDREWYRNTYLLSGHWQETREKRLEIDEHKCFICGAEKGLDVHHLNYDRLWKEDVRRDLVTLCRKCHHKIHEFAEREKKAGAREKEEFESEVIRATIAPYIWYERERRRRVAQYMMELPIKQGQGHDVAIEGLLNQFTKCLGEVTINTRTGGAGKTRVTIGGHAPSATALCRVWTGKRKIGKINTEEEWNKAFDAAVEEIEVKHDDDG